MTKRFLSDKTIEFVVAGQPPTQGSVRGRNEAEENGSCRNGINEFKSLVIMCAKNAIAEQGWELDSSNACYVVLTVNLKPNSTQQRTLKKLKKRELANVFPLRTPTLDRILTAVTVALEGVLYEKREQVIGTTVLKKYNMERGSVEVLVGVAKTWSELNYDLRNA